MRKIVFHSLFCARPSRRCGAWPRPGRKAVTEFRIGETFAATRATSITIAAIFAGMNANAALMCATFAKIGERASREPSYAPIAAASPATLATCAVIAAT